MRNISIIMMACALVLSLGACKRESGERDAGCEGKPSEVVAKEINADNHPMLTLNCGGTFNWYVTWDEGETGEYDRYELYDIYSG